MRIKDFFVRHQTLLRFVVTVALVAIVLFVFYGWSVFRHSQAQISQQHEQSYARVVAQLNAGFNDQLPVMISAAQLFQRQNNTTPQWLESQFYNFILTIDELNACLQSVWIADDLFLVLRDTPYVLSSRYKYESDFFLRRYSGGNEDFEALLRAALYDQPIDQMTILPGFPYGVDTLYIAVPYTNAQGVMLFALTEESMQRYFLGVADDTGIGFALLDEHDQVMLASSSIRADVLVDRGFAGFLASTASTNVLHIAGEDYILAQSHSPKYGLGFVVVHGQSVLSRSLGGFYRYLRQITVVMVLLLAAMISFTVYMNFRPITRLVKRFGKPKDPAGEIDTLYRTFTDYSVEAQQMQDTMRANILRRLIEGHVVSADALAELGLHSGDGYCVLAIAGITLSAEQCKQLAHRATQGSVWQVYVTTLPYESYIILLCALAQPPKTDTQQDHRLPLASVVQISAASLAAGSAAQGSAPPPRVGIGAAVQGAEDIHRSYLGALTAIESQSAENIVLYEDRALEFGDLECDYTKRMLKLFEHLRQGEKTRSELALREVFDYVLLHASSTLVQKYFCYDIINSYLKYAQKHNLEMSSQIHEAILHGDTPQMLYQSMLKSIAQVCERLSRRQESQRINAIKEVADYVEANFTDPALSLESIAGRFGLSIYVVSRMLKEYWNCGYKEYLTAKRIKYGMQLLEKGDQPIADIALAAGFNDVLHFSRTFRANTGMSPTKYRQIMVAGDA